MVSSHSLSENAYLGSVDVRTRPSELERGEFVAAVASAVVDRMGRAQVQVRIVGDSSFGWLETSYVWGCHVDATVFVKPNLTRLASRLYSQVKNVSVLDAYSFPPRRRWQGVLLASIMNKEDCELVSKLFHVWHPSVMIVALHGKLSRREMFRLSPEVIEDYSRKVSEYQHDQVGGVTTSRWHILFYSRTTSVDLGSMRMITSAYPRTLQTVLDDVLPPSHERYEFEKVIGQDNLLGYVQFRRKSRLPVYDSSKLAPDPVLSYPSIQYFWVQANSVWRKAHPVLRPITLPELMATWDFEYKLSTKTSHFSEMEQLYLLRLCSPPAKILRDASYKVFDVLLRDGRPSVNVESLKAELIPIAQRETTVFSKLEDLVSTRVSAALPDDAEADLSLWSYEGETKAEERARDILRHFVTKWWYYHTEKCAWKWFKNHGSHPRDAAAIADCLRRAKAAGYWQWHRGSKLFFWKFPDEWKEDMRDGVPFFHLKDPPTGFLRNLPTERENEIALRKKIFRLKFRWYLERGFVDLIISRFDVEKPNDIRCVWDASRNGLNESLWAPKFILPTSSDAEDLVVKWLPMTVGDYINSGSPLLDYVQNETYVATFQTDLDVEEMFNEFALHPSERHAAGVRHVETRKEGCFEPETVLRWTVLFFGGKPCPYLSCQAQSRILECCTMDRQDPNNPFQWDRVHLNLPTAEHYDPSLPRVILLRKDNEMASRHVTYVDDIHIAGRGNDKCNGATKYLASKMNSYGNQESVRKRRPPSQNPGAWNGEIIATYTPFPLKSTTGKKWVKFKAGLLYILEKFDSGEEFIETAQLRRIQGLGVNITSVYPNARPYLKGMFNASESWRPNRDENGWRDETLLQNAELLEVNDASNPEASAGYPLHVKLTEELELHTRALMELFSDEEPLVVPIRPQDSSKLRYHIGDASAEGFGAATQFPNQLLEGRDGLWDKVFSTLSSNWREAQNIVNHLSSQVKEGLHDGCEIWSFTDNFVWSAIWNKGMSSVKHLFEAVLSLKILCQKHAVFLHVCHISGERMIATGMDGWSRGNYDAGISLGYDLRLFVPLSISAFDFPGNQLTDWCKGWMKTDFSSPLSPEGWFSTGHQPGVHLWAPPPAAALIVLKEVAKSRHKRPYFVTHVILIPRILFEEEWRTRFEKEVDLWFYLNTGDAWPHSAFEPLIVGISFPMRRTYPWLVRLERTKVVERGRELSSLSKESHLRVRDYLCKLWESPWEIPSL